jgi:hypothetical protein
MAGGKVRHWKHGWIPVSPEAKAYVAGHGPKPSVFGGHAPTQAGIPKANVKGDLAGGQERASTFEELMPELGQVEPHYQFESQNMPGHYTGGVVLRGGQADVMIDKLESSEGTASGASAARAAGFPINPKKGSPESVAKRRANRIQRALKLPAPPTPEYFKAPTNEVAGRQSGFTGGVVFSKYVADQTISALRERRTGTTSVFEARRAAGLR